MTKSTWEVLRIVLSTTKDLPSWLKDQGELSFEQVAKLPMLGSEPQGTVARPHVTEETIKPDYFDFLREQIQLEPRGPEWTKVLEARLNALQPFAGKTMLMASFYRKPNSATLYVVPDSNELLLIEVF